MRSRQLVFSAYIQGLLLLLGLTGTLGQQPASDLSYCQLTNLVRDFYNPNQYLVICTECNVQYVLSFDLQKCIYYKESNDNNLLFCKRLGRKGICEEALCAIQLNEKGEYISKQYGNNDENCAQFDSSTKACIYPRLQYVLDQDSQIISKDTDNYCAIKKGTQCLQYHSSILPQADYAVFLTEFYNFEEIDIQAYTNEGKLKCNLGFELQLNEPDQKKSYFGCVISDYQITNCASYNKSRTICTQCETGFSLNQNGRECLLIDHCVSHYMQYYCLKCEPFYYLQSGKCIEIKNCAVLAQDGVCGFCKSPYYGSYCENQNKTMPDSCELIDRIGMCTKCKNNEKYFFNFKSNQCQIRQLSNYCKVKSYISDECDTLECNQGYHFLVDQYEYQLGYFYNQEYYSCQQLEDMFRERNYYNFQNYEYEWDYINIRNPINIVYYYKYVQNKFEIKPFCVKTENIENCISYDKCYQSCNKCAEGFSLQQRNDSYTQYYYRFICVKDSEITNQIPHCLQYNKQSQNCEKCEQYYYNTYSSCEIGTVQNCLIYGDYNNCYQCEKNYTLNSNQCFYVELCQEYQWNGYNIKCTKCIQKPDVVISLVQTSNSYRSDCVQNQGNDVCSQYLDDQCIQCSRNYVLIEETNRCVREQEVIDFCLISNDQFQCQQCVSDYRLVNSKCFRVNGSCTSRYSCDHESCSIECNGLKSPDYNCYYQCPANYFMMYDTTCYKCSDYSGEGCIKCDNSGQCLECIPGFSFDPFFKKCRFTCSNGQIVDYQTQCSNCLDKNCVSCSSPDICNYCSNNFYLQENKCVEKCDFGYTNSWYGAQNICYKCDENCEYCYLSTDLKTTYCNKCKSGLYIKNDKCEVCEQFLYSSTATFDFTYCKDYCDKYLKDRKYCVDYCDKQFIVSIYNYMNDGKTYQVCTDDCPYFTQYYDWNGKNCLEKCDIGYFVNSNLRICQKCSTQNCSSCLNDIDKCDSCNYPYILSNNYCFYKCQNGLIVQNKTECSCNEYCDSCQGGICSQCKSGYYYFKDEKNFELSYCTKNCPDGYFQAYGNCYGCTENCLSCSNYNSCDVCKAGYVPISFSFYKDNTTYSYVNCYFLCPDGSKSINPAMCACSDKYCNKCTNPYICESCKDGYIINDKGICVLNDNSSCKITNCQSCTDLASCDVCFDGWDLISGICKYKCLKTGELVSAPENCSNYTVCFVNDCDLCDSSNTKNCLKCKSSYFLQDGACYKTCIEGFYQTKVNEQPVCKQCNFLCKSCTSENECTSCKVTNNLSNKCMCPTGQKLYKNKCVQKCPFYSTLIDDNICIEHCIDGLYPHYTANKEQRMCEEVKGFNSNFCYQNIENIPDILSISLNKATKEDTEYKLKIRLEQTPSLCYDIAFKGVEENQFPVSLDSEDFEETIYSVVIPKESIKNNVIQCSDSQCQAQIEIYFAEVVQYVVLITINFDIDIIVTNGVSYSGSYDVFNAVCPTCSIPSSLVAKSTISVTCPASQTCSSEGIQTSTNSQISIVQSISDPRFLNNKLQPHSVRLVYMNSKGEEVTLYITNYFYDNSILGQISYSFKVIALKPGKLVLTSLCNSANYSPSRRLLASSTSNNSVFYPQMTVPFTLTDYEIENKPNSTGNDKNIDNTETVENTTAIIIAASCGGAIFFLIVGIIIYRKYRKGKSKNSSEYLRPSQTQSNPQLTTEQQVIQTDTQQQEIELII